MKKTILLFATFSIAFAVFAQKDEKVNYKILRNDPQNFHPRLNINLLIGGLDLGIKNISGVNFYLGVHGNYMLTDRLGVQFNMNRAFLSLGRLGFAEYPTAKDFNAGGLLLLTHATKLKQVKVILKIERGQNSQGRETQTTTYLMVPGTKEVYNGVRGGLYYKGGAFGLDDQKNDGLDLLNFEKASLNSVGVYAGLLHRTLTNIIIDTDKYKQCMNSLGSDVYIDLLVIPINRITLLNDPGAGSFKKDQNVTDEVNKYVKASPIGFRLGFSGYQIAPKSVIGKKFGMSYNFEAGLLPYQGWFIRGGIGLTLVKTTTTQLPKK